MIFCKGKLYLLLLFVVHSSISFGQEGVNINNSRHGFIENKGQIHDQNYKPNPDVKYLLNLNNGLNVQLRTNGFSYDTYVTERTKNKKNEIDEFRHPFDSIEDYDITYHFHRIDIELLNANPNPEIIAEYPSADYLNYYNTVTPEEGATFVHSFQKVTYKGIYPSIDIEFFIQEDVKQPFKYNIIVHPGADLSQIKLQYNGANNLQLVNGKILIETSNGNFHESLPESWLLENKQAIKAQYKAFDENTFGFRLKEYSKDQTLVIDPLPIMDWATYYGGTGGEGIFRITIDNNNKICFIGNTESSNSIATTGTHQTAYGGGSDVIIGKLNDYGQILWCTYYGGNKQDNSGGIVTDNNGNTFITGFSSSTTGIATSGAHQEYLGGGYYADGFIAKFDSTGQRLWGTYYGGTSSDIGLGIAIDTNINIYITGRTQSTADIATSGAFQTTNAGYYDGFIVKFNSSGSRQWGTYYGGSGLDKGHDIDIDNNGNVYVTGETRSSFGIATIGTHQTTYNGGHDAFIIKFNSAGQRQWGTYYGGVSQESVYSIVTDQNGNICIAGNTNSTSGIATSNTHQPIFGGGTNDVFIAKFNSAGQRLWGTYYGGSDWEYQIPRITTDRNNNVYLIGTTESTNAIVTPGSYQTTFGGNHDAFIVRFNPSCQRLWGTYYGGSNFESGLGIATDRNGHVYVSGTSMSTSGIATSGAYQQTNGGSGDAFIAKFIACYRSFDTINITACDSFYFKGKMLYDSETCYDTLLNYQYCDSIITFNISIKKKYNLSFIVNDSSQCLKGNNFLFSENTIIDTGSIVSYFWDFGDSDTSTFQSPTHTYSTSDTFIVKLFVVSSFGCKDSLYKNVIVYPSPEADYYFNDSNQCFFGNFFQLTNISNISNGSQSFYWDLGDGVNSDSINPIHSYSYFDTFQVKLIATSNLDCPDSITKTAVVFPMPEAGFSIFDSTQCLRDNNFVFTNQSTILQNESLSYIWDFGDSDTSSIKNTNHTYSVYDTLNVSLISTSSNLCSDTTNHLVIVHPMPKADYFIWDTSQCFERNAFEFTNTSSIPYGSIDYFWRFGDGSISNLKDPVYSYSYPDTFNVHLLATSANGCQDSTFGLVYIHVHPEPVSLFSIDDSAQCLSDNLFDFTNLTSISSGSFTQTWYFGDGDTLQSLDALHSYSVYDTLKVRLLIVSDWFCKDSFEKTVVINPMPKASFVSDTSSMCLNNNIFNFSDQSIIPYGNINQLLWDFGDGNSTNQQNPTYSFLSVDSFKVKLVATSLNNCPDSIIKEVAVRPMPNAKFDISDSSQCLSGNLFQFNNLSSIIYGNLDYNWKFGDNDSSKIVNPTHSYGWFDTFGIRLIANSDFNCKDTLYGTAIVHPMPVAAFNINDSDQCLRDNLYEFSNQSNIPHGILNYIWDFGDNDSSTILNPDHSYLSDDLYTIKLLAISGQDCRDSIEKQLIVWPMPHASFTVNDSTQCLTDNSFEFINTTTINYGSITFSWLVDKDPYLTNEPPTTKFKEWGKYSAQLIATSNFGCLDTAFKFLDVYPMPMSAFIYLNNCLEDTMWFFDSSHVDSGSIAQWFWDFKNGNTSSSQNPFTIYYDTGQKSVTLVSTTDFGCATDTTRFFTIESKVVAPILERATVENDEHILIEWLKPIEGIPMTYHLERSDDGAWWDYLSDEDKSTFNYEDYMVYPDMQSYFYRVSVTDSCEFTAEYSNNGKTILLRVDSNEAHPRLTWTAYEEWEEGVASYELQVAGLDLQSSNNSTYQPVTRNPKPVTFKDSLTNLKAASYCYRVIAYRNVDSLQSVSNVVCIPTEFRLFAPNSFTPNGDNVNDIFLPKGIFVSEFNLQIFNRWGEKVFESDDIKEGWDGRFKGMDCQLGTYYYHITAKGVNGEAEVRSGTVLLLK